MPSPAPVYRVVLRLRCPHCGRGPLFRTMFTVRDRCAVCGFVFNRGNPAYFSGAIFINYLLGAGATLAAFLVLLVATWPTVPWNALSYAVPAAAVVAILVLNPVSKAILLAVDVRMRPITEDELMAQVHEEYRVRP